MTYFPGRCVSLCIKELIHWHLFYKQLFQPLINDAFFLFLLLIGIQGGEINNKIYKMK
jgi:hypothetical protein